MKIEKKWVVIVGFGNRGQVYADYCLEEPDELGIKAIVDVNSFKLKEAKDRYGLEDNQLYSSLDEFLKDNVKCDLVINATMDQLHYDTALKIIDAGYDMLIEKPIVPNAEQLLDIKKHAIEHQTKVFVCHVLRYTPFYSNIKKLLNEGRIGEIISIEMNEHVSVPHYLASYTRGKWNSEEKCGSGFILAKSCHDLDIMCWLNNDSAPKSVSSFGQRIHYIPEKAPKDSAEYCYQCKYEKECLYSAIDQYINKDIMPFLVWADMDKPLDEITKEEKLEYLKHNIYGKCAFKCGGDIVDRQNAIVNFENGSVATFNLIGGCLRPGRFLHIVGTMGEIIGYLEEDKFTLRTYDEEFNGVNEEIEVHPINNVQFGGHSGGDYSIMHDLIRYLNGDESSVSITSLEDSVNGHLCIFAAEKSRNTNRIIDINDIV